MRHLAHSSLLLALALGCAAPSTGSSGFDGTELGEADVDGTE